jgi:hypothetical protein
MAHHAAFHKCHLLRSDSQERQVYWTAPRGEKDVRATFVPNSVQEILCRGSSVFGLTYVSRESSSFFGIQDILVISSSTFDSPGAGTRVQTNLYRSVDLERTTYDTEPV